MHPALISFLEEYKKLLKSTDEMCETTQKRFVEIQQQIRENGVTDSLLSELFKLHHSLFRTSYFLMESHTRVDNIRANYSEEDQKLIDDYEEVSKKAGVLVYHIISYKSTIEKTDNSGLNI